MIFLVYMVDGSVMVTFISKQVNTFVLLEMNYGGAKIPYFVDKCRLSSCNPECTNRLRAKKGPAPPP